MFFYGDIREINIYGNYIVSQNFKWKRTRHVCHKKRWKWLELLYTAENGVTVTLHYRIPKSFVQFFLGLVVCNKVFLFFFLMGNHWAFYTQMYDRSPPLKRFLLAPIISCSFVCTCTLPKMNRVYHPHLLTSFSLFSRVGGKKENAAPCGWALFVPTVYWIWAQGIHTAENSQHASVGCRGGCVKNRVFTQEFVVQVCDPICFFITAVPSET